MEEIFKDIDGLEGLYQVSNFGNVISLNYNHSNSRRLMSLSKSSSGYLHVQLYKNSKSKTYLVHKLVASAFIQNPNDLPEVNHIDGNKTNNNAKNLEWVSRSENQKHAIEHSLRKPSPNISNEAVYSNKGIIVLQYRLDGSLVKVWNSVKEAAEYIGSNPKPIYRALSKDNTQCYGYMWKKYTGGDIDETIPKYSRQKRIGKKQINRRPTMKICQYSKDGNLIKVWNGYLEIEESLHISNANIYHCISGRYKTAYGYVWKYAE